MNFDNVIALRDQFVRQIRQAAESRIKQGLESFAAPSPESRIAIGYSQLSKTDYQLEIRTNRDSGYGRRLAERYKEEAKGEANIEVVKEVHIPTLKELEAEKSKLGERMRPLHIGLSIGPASGGTGTLGAFLSHSKGEAILSNNHVLANLNKATKHEPIFQPGPIDADPVDENVVANLYNFLHLTKDKVNKYDGAIALLDTAISDLGDLENRIPKGYDFPGEGERIQPQVDLDSLTPNEVVCKIGRSTGFTKGRLTALSLQMFTLSTTIGNLVFNDIIEVTWISRRERFTRPGDSGSLVFTEKGRIPIGLHFAGAEGEGKSYACSLDVVLAGLKASLL